MALQHPPPSRRLLGGFTAPYLDSGSGSLTKEGPPGVPGVCTGDSSSLSLQVLWSHWSSPAFATGR